MTARDGRVGVSGVVAALLPKGLVRVAVEGTTSDVIAHVADDPARNFVRLIVGDRVHVEIAPRDPSRGRITRRLRR
jgi:translation initiation factor IF-1